LILKIAVNQPATKKIKSFLFALIEFPNIGKKEKLL
jgi:hypothetical protein